MGRELPEGWYSTVYATARGWRGPTETLTLYPVWKEVVAATFRLRPSAVIDVGCGPGHVGTLLLRSPLARSMVYIGIDFSEEALRQGKGRLGGDQRASFHREDLSAGGAPLRQYHRDGSCYVLSEFLEHIRKDLEVLVEIPEGSPIVLTVPDCPGSPHVRWFAHEG